MAETFRKRWTLPALEALVAFTLPALFIATCIFIRVSPRDRLGQISGIAHLELRFFLFALVLLAALAISARVRGGRHFDVTARLVSAGIAGLATGLIAGGVLVALRGTPFGLHTKGGDVTKLVEWATALQRGTGDVPPMYPPLSLHLLATYSDLAGLHAEHGVKHLQIAGTAAFGPVAYLAWRMFLRPAWALGVGVVACLALIDPYKPYPNLVLVAFLPLALKFLQVLRELPQRTVREVLISAIGLGAAFGMSCLLYSGWFQWAVPGMFAAILIVFPWRTAWKGALLYLGVTGVVFLLFAGKYVAAMLFNPDAAIVDNYVYFDVRVEPMYIAMWRNDLPGQLMSWPPIGELGGVGLFTILLIAGLGGAITLGRKHTLVIGLVSLMTGAWLFRFFYARLLWETKLVQLYPRTTALIFYCLVVLTGLALYWWSRRASVDHPVRQRSGLVGGLVGLLLLFASAGGSVADRYMPFESTPPGPGILAWTAHEAQRDARGRFHWSRSLIWVRRPIAPPTP